MKNRNSGNGRSNKHSLGYLKPAFKNKQKSPDLLGKIDLRVKDIERLAAQADRSEDGEVRADLAGWYNEKEGDKYLSVVLSVQFEPPEHAPVRPSSIPPYMFFQDDESEDE